MKPSVLTVATLLLTLTTAASAVLVLRHRPRAPEPVAEQWPAPEAAPTTAPSTAPVRAEPPRADPIEPPPVAPIAAARPPDTPVPDAKPRVGPSHVVPKGPAPNALSLQCRGTVYDPREYVRRHGRCPPPSGDTPLVLSFDGAPVEYLADRAHAFDVDGDASLVTDWPTARTPWLALDRDGDGRISDGSELFGSMTVLSTGERAENGFAALRELDADGDGRITPNDPGFARLLVWADRDGDRRSSPGELASAGEWELLSIDLDYTVDPRCDARGNCEVERASFRWRDAAGVVRTGAVVDVHLAAQR